MDKLNNEGLVGDSWDKKKIVVSVIIIFFLAGVAYAAKTYVLDSSDTKTLKKVSTKSSGEVAGISIEDIKDSSADENNDQPPPFSFSPATIRTDVQQKIDALKEQVTNLKVEEVASASPQIQKVINDLKALEQYPKSQAKQMCENICKSL